MRDLTAQEILTVRNGIGALHVVLSLLDEDENEIRALAGDVTSPSIHEESRQATIRTLVERRRGTDAATAVLRAVLAQATRAPLDG